MAKQPAALFQCLRNAVIQPEFTGVENIAANFIVVYNTIPVKKKNGNWRMYIDFTDLNKACPKDDFLLPKIDKVVDDAANSQMMSLLDCFSGYHQIWMRKEDEEKTSFITPFYTYCSIRMPEGLKNAGQLFSRMTSKLLAS